MQRRPPRECEPLEFGRARIWLRGGGRCSLPKRRGVIGGERAQGVQRVGLFVDGIQGDAACNRVGRQPRVTGRDRGCEVTTKASGGGDQVLGGCYGGIDGGGPDSRNRQSWKKASDLDEGLVLGGREEVQRVVKTSCAQSKLGEYLGPTSIASDGCPLTSWRHLCLRESAELGETCVPVSREKKSLESRN